LPNFPYREEAARIIRLKSNVLLRSQRFGKNKTAAVTALIHLILRKYNEVRPLKEICDTIALDQRLVMKYAWAMRKMTNMHRTFTAQDYLRKFAWELTSDATLIQAGDDLLTNLRKEVGGNPISLAAGVFYFVCQERKIRMSKDKIGEAFHISNRTVYSNERRISRFMSAKGIRS
jgi:transcription initiation factor TFIIIB Brf1 subunit/transcription initiation factor TFIIB